MRLTLLLAVLLAAPAWAQITYSPTANGTYQALDGTTIAGPINVRLKDCPAGPWSYAIDGTPRNVEQSCPFDLGGDNYLLTLSAGAHVITATGSATYTASFTVGTTPLPPGPTWTGTQGLAWTPPTLNADGSTLTDLAGYLILFGTAADALTSQVSLTDPALTAYTLTGLSPGRYYLGMRAVNASGIESDLSNLIQFQLVDSTPACSAKPADETRTNPCAAPATGSWTQTRTYTEATYPTCWSAGEWLPATAPSSACAAPVTWAVKVITAGVRPAYELIRNQADTAWARGYKLGDIAVDKPCESTRLLGTSTSEYHQVAEADVVLLSPTYKGRTLIAICARQ